MVDPIADMLNRIRNAQAVKRTEVLLPFSNLKYEIAQILEKKKFVDKAEKRGRKIKKFINITLKYENGAPAISGLKRISRPGQRIYVSARAIRQVKGGYGISIISTSKGLMTNKGARKNKLGGEILCEIW